MLEQNMKAGEYYVGTLLGSLKTMIEKLWDVDELCHDMWISQHGHMQLEPWICTIEFLL